MTIIARPRMRSGLIMRALFVEEEAGSNLGLETKDTPYLAIISETMDCRYSVRSIFANLGRSQDPEVLF